MSDIFVSYANEDRDRVLPLVEALEKTGWSIFWDRIIPFGKTWRQVIHSEIQSCRSVLVVWTEHSVNSEWVQEEAEIGKRRKILFPVLLDNVEPPFGFGSIQAANLVAWNGSDSATTFTRIISDFTATLGPAPAASLRRRVNEQDEREREQDWRREEENLRRIEEEKRRVAAEAERQRIQVENPRKPSRFFQELLLSVNNPTTYGLGALTVLLVVGSIVWLLNWKPSEAPTNPTEEQTSRTNQSTPDTSQKPPEPTTPVTVKSEAARPTEAKPLPPAAAKPAMAAGKGFRDRLKIGGEGPEMIALPPGKFQMGNPQGKGGFEVPVHAVQIGRSFALGRYEVTFDEYDQFAKSINRMLPDDRDWGRGRRPVINVSWDDANAYVKWLSEQTQKRYRLPTEAEWEYAARAGAKAPYWWGEEPVRGLANCKGCGSQWDNKHTAPVGSFKSNGFELFDTAGNIWEWVEDCWHDNYNGAPSDGRPWKDETGGKCYQRVRRGGSWNSGPEFLRSSSRVWGDAVDRSSFIGFRLAQDLK